MNDKYKIRAVLGDDNSTMLSELQVLLSEELSRPEEDCDLDYVAELTQAITELSAGSLTDEETDRNIGVILDEIKAQDKRSRLSRFTRCASAAAACAVFAAALNFYTLASFGTDLVTTAVRLTQGGFTIDFSQDPEDDIISTVTPTIPNDVQEWSTDFPTDDWTASTETSDIGAEDTTAAEETETAAATTAVPTDIPTEATTDEQPGAVDYDIETPTVYQREEPNFGDFSGGWTSSHPGTVMREKCLEHGILTAAPADNARIGMELTDYSYIQLENSEDFYFTFSNPYQQLDIILECYTGRSTMPELMIPSDSADYETGRYGIGTAYFFPDAELNTAVFAHGGIIYTVIGQNVSLDALRSIVASFESGN